MTCRSNITACTYHITKFPLHFCYKENLMKQKFQQDIWQNTHVWHPFCHKQMVTWRMVLTTFLSISISPLSHLTTGQVSTGQMTTGHQSYSPSLVVSTSLMTLFQISQSCAVVLQWWIQCQSRRRCTYGEPSDNRLLLLQLLVKLGKTETQLGDYELLEVAHKAGDSGVTTRVLGMNDRILQGQNKGRRRDKFMLRQREVPLRTFVLGCHSNS